MLYKHPRGTAKFEAGCHQGGVGLVYASGRQGSMQSATSRAKTDTPPPSPSASAASTANSPEKVLTNQLESMTRRIQGAVAKFENLISTPLKQANGGSGKPRPNEPTSLVDKLEVLTRELISINGAIKSMNSKMASTEKLAKEKDMQILNLVPTGHCKRRD